MVVSESKVSELVSSSEAEFNEVKQWTENSGAVRQRLVGQ